MQRVSCTPENHIYPVKKQVNGHFSTPRHLYAAAVVFLPSQLLLYLLEKVNLNSASGTNNLTLKSERQYQCSLSHVAFMCAPLLEFPLSGSGLILFLSYLFAHLDKFIYGQSLQLSVTTTYSRVGFIHWLLMKELKDKLRGCKMYHFFTTGKRKKKQCC